MKRTGIILTLVLVSVLVGSNAMAIDRDAAMIDELNLEATSYDEADYFGFSITVENVMAAASGNWALIAGIGTGELEFDGVAQANDAIWGGLGVKWYMTPVTGISLMGTWRELDYEGFEDVEILGATAEIKQRLLPASMAISPYIKGQASFQEIDHPAGYLSMATSGTYTEVVLAAYFGCEFMMNDSMAWVLEAGISESEEFDDGDDTQDGFLARLAMRYYWD